MTFNGMLSYKSECEVRLYSGGLPVSRMKAEGTPVELPKYVSVKDRV